MDTKKIGTFLSQLRHEKNLTQEQLGEQLGVTNKTVSRWENGNYMPPVEILMQLSEFYGISINEILSGQRLEDSAYKEKAEENIKMVLESSAFQLEDRIAFFQKKWKKDHAFSLTVEMLIILAVMAAGFLLDNGLQFVGILAGFIWSIVKYNQMMTYVERNAYGKKN